MSDPITITTTAGLSPPPLLDQVRQLALARGHDEPTTPSFVNWIRQFILYHHKRHPRELALAEIGQFLDHVVRTSTTALVSANAARTAGVFVW